jgi:Chaperone of endosialidase
MLKRLASAAAALTIVSGAANAACPGFTTFTNGTPANAPDVNNNFIDVTTCFAQLSGPHFTGNVGIGTASPTATLEVNGLAKFDNQISVTGLANFTGYGSVADPWGSIWTPLADSATFPMVFKNASGGNVGLIQTTSTATAYVTTSDRRLKENILPTSQGLDTLMRVEVDDFNYINSPKNNRVQGMIAQDLYNVYPQAVVVGGDDTKSQPWGIDYGRITPLLVKALQELKTENDNLRSEFETYKTAHP